MVNLFFLVKWHTKKKKKEAKHGPSYRHGFDFCDVNPSTGVWEGTQSMMMHGPGQSGNLFSDYYENFVEMWGRTEYVNIDVNNYPVVHEIKIKSQ